VIVNTAAAPRASPAFAGISREELERGIRNTPFAALLGAELLDYGDGRAALSVPIVQRVLQHHGFVHGAVIGFLADSACAWAAASIAGDVVTAEYKLNLIAPATGSRLVARGEVIKSTGRQVICRADVFAEKDGNMRMVATALATIARLRPSPGGRLIDQ
jgi:uncharacterized protein (TIGR00369 family)